MAEYMIHTMPKRMWYVEKYLIPSMVSQGIRQNDIQVYNDEKSEGNLKACMNAFAQMPENSDGTWHLQDDIIISSKFKQLTEKHDDGIVCGFKSVYDGDRKEGLVKFNDSWFSFLCIRIPNYIAKQCSEWVTRYMIGNPVYKEYWEGGVNDDWMFRQFVHTMYPNAFALNLKPNIVDHIDYLIGGTVNSSKRIIQIRAKYWEDEYLVDELANKLNRR